MRVPKEDAPITLKMLFCWFGWFIILKTNGLKIKLQVKTIIKDFQFHQGPQQLKLVDQILEGYH